MVFAPPYLEQIQIKANILLLAKDKNFTGVAAEFAKIYSVDGFTEYNTFYAETLFSLRTMLQKLELPVAEATMIYNGVVDAIDFNTNKQLRKSEFVIGLLSKSSKSTQDFLDVLNSINLSSLTTEEDKNLYKKLKNFVAIRVNDFSLLTK